MRGAVSERTVVITGNVAIINKFTKFNIGSQIEEKKQMKLTINFLCLVVDFCIQFKN